IVLDKTGTITQGRPAVTDIVVSEQYPVVSNSFGQSDQSGSPDNGSRTLDRDYWLRLAAAAERGSEHPLGEAIVREAEMRGLDAPGPEAFEAIAGHGMAAPVDGRRVLVGNRRLMERENVHLNGLAVRAEALEAAARTTMWVAVEWTADDRPPAAAGAPSNGDA